jgi:3-methyladenine DNA glycosylase AlkD
MPHPPAVASPVATELAQALRAAADPEKAKAYQRFFKTGPVEYGEGDVFIGVAVPAIRALAKTHAPRAQDADVRELLQSPIHEERLLALLLWVEQSRRAAKRGDRERVLTIARRYEEYIERANNWDLVDTSAEPILAPAYGLEGFAVWSQWLTAAESSLWRRRVAILASFSFARQNRPDLSVQIAELAIVHRHPLLQKATGWLLRDMNQRCGGAWLTDFLTAHHKTLGRTALRTAIEHFSPEDRKRWM